MSRNNTALRITVHLREDDPDLKSMIKTLSKTRAEGNPFVDRSESEIARMLLVQEVQRLFNLHCAIPTA